ncbi:MAG: trigger factor [Nitrospinota bacterium]|nr:trigger factor [Nitrospinota bacterium]
MSETTISDVSDCTKTLEAGIPSEQVSSAIDMAFQNLSGRANIKGFRKGKIPRKVLERFYGEELRAEVYTNLISDSYTNILNEKGMRPVGEPNITDIKMNDDSTELTYKATLEVIPPIDLKDYKGMEVNIHSHPITDELIDENIKRLLYQSATFEDVDRSAESGDYVVFDIEAFKNGEPVSGTKGENQSLILGETQNEKLLDESVLGMKAGDKKEVDFQPPGSTSEEYDEQKFVFKLDLKSVKKPNLPNLDDDFVISLGSEMKSVVDLRMQVEEDLKMSEENQNRQEGIRKLIEQIMENHPLQVPPTLVKNEIEERMKDVERRYKSENPEVEITETHREEIRLKLKPEAEKRVHELILIHRIREIEGISIGPEEIDLHIEETARRYGMEVEKLKKRMAMTGSLESLFSNLKFNKTLNWLYDEAKVEVEIHNVHDHSHDEKVEKDDQIEEG